MRKAKKNITETLLVSYLVGELGDNEKSAVAQAISVNVAVRKHFEQLQMVWNESGKMAKAGAVNVDDAWSRFRQRIEQGNNVKSAFPLPAPLKWIRVAAVLLMLAGGCLIGYYKISNKEVAVITENSSVDKLEIIPGPATIVATDDATLPGDNGEKKAAKNKISVVSVAAKKVQGPSGDVISNKAKEICNGTTVPLEICIIQKLKCPNGQSSIVATCNKLEPHESNRLQYKNAETTNCNAVVDEIRIRRVATGETIVFNADSKPVTARELFSYISGEKKGDVVAGVFDTDCLAFDSKSGDFVLQQCPAGYEENCN